MNPHDVYCIDRSIRIRLIAENIITEPTAASSNSAILRYCRSFPAVNLRRFPPPAHASARRHISRRAEVLPAGQMKEGECGKYGECASPHLHYTPFFPCCHYVFANNSTRYGARFPCRILQAHCCTVFSFTPIFSAH